MTIQVNPPIPVYIVDKEVEGWIHFFTDYGPESYIYFTILTDSGEWWTLDNTKVRGCFNTSMNRYPKNDTKKI